MPYSQQTWSGQGMRGPSVAPMGGQIIASSLANMGQSIGAGIEKFQQAKGEAKGLRNKLRGFGDAYGMEEKVWNDHLDNLGLNELKGLGENLIIKQASELHKMKMAEGKQRMEHAASQESREQEAAQQAETDRAYAASMIGGDAETMSKVGAAPSVRAMETISDIKAQQNLNAYRDAQVQDLQREHQQKLNDAQKRGGLNEEQAKLSNDLFTKLHASEPVKNFSGLNAQYAALENLIMSKEKLDGPGDIAMVFTFMKSLDPRSVVRESEFEVAAKAGGLPEQLVNEYTRLKSGGFITSDMKRKFLKAARQAAKAYEDAANIQRQSYIDQGGRFGLPEEYAAGKPFRLNRREFENEEEVYEAQEAGMLKPGQEIFILQPSGKYRKARSK